MASKLSLEDTITSVKGVGEQTAQKLQKLDIHTIKDLLDHIPRKYLDYSHPTPIYELRIKKPACFSATLSEPKTYYTKTGKLVTETTATNNTGNIRLIWFNNHFIKRVIRENELYSVAGTPSFFGHLAIISPTIEPKGDDELHTKGIIPIYPQTSGITSRYLRKIIRQTLQGSLITETIPIPSLEKIKLPTLSTAYQQIHFPKDIISQKTADKRLSLEEHLAINKALQKDPLHSSKSLSIKISDEIHQKIEESLPFKLTEDQQKAINLFYKDLSKDNFTHRLVMGDTGSGKTMILIFSADQAIKSNLSCAILAPTKILAHQHFQTFNQYSRYKDHLVLITSETKIKPTNKPTIFIGTHALLSKLDEHQDPPLLFVGIDEQHRFGVNQQEKLLRRDPAPHLINLSATPIPRTLALGLLGDIKISKIRHKPQNRLPIKTFVYPPAHFQKGKKWLTDKIKEGNRVFVICPNIKENENEVSAVQKVVGDYQKNFPKINSLVLHGQMKPEEQRQVLNEFKEGKPGFLISTSIIEVGIDIKDANIIAIHSAERFGLAQLHQLRGRVGRGEVQGYCFLIPSKDDDEENERLNLLTKYHSGLTLAKKDFALRGAGDIYGQDQHGHLNTRLRYFWSKKLFQLAKSLTNRA